MPPTTTGGDTATLRARVDELRTTVDALKRRVDQLSAALQVAQDGSVTITGPRVRVASATIVLDAATVQGGGVLRCDTLIANLVVGGSYTPGPGNVW